VAVDIQFRLGAVHRQFEKVQTSVALNHTCNIGHCCFSEIGIADIQVGI